MATFADNSETTAHVYSVYAQIRPFDSSLRNRSIVICIAKCTCINYAARI